MVKKRALMFLIFGLMASLVASLISSVSAAGFYVSSRDISQSVINSWVNFLEPILQALFGGYGWSGMFLFERLLLFILLIAVISVALTKVPLFGDDDRKAVRWVITIIVPLIGMRYINFEWLSAIILQYRALAIILTAVIPFIIYFYFLYNVDSDYGALRKVGWLLFIGIYAGLWSTTENDANATIYIWTVVAAILCLVFDNLIMRRMRIRKLMNQDTYFKTREIGNTNMEIQKIQQQMAAGAIDRKSGEKAVKDLNKHKRWLIRQN